MRGEERREARAFGPGVEVGEREEHVAHEGENAVVGHVAGLAEGRAQLLVHDGRRVEQVDFARLLARAHLPARQARHHRVHEVHALLVAERRQVLLGEREDLPLVHAAELHVDAEVLLVQRLLEGQIN